MPIIVLDTIQGSSILAIQPALEVFQRPNRDVAQYVIKVVRDELSVVVIFADRDGQTGARETVGVRPGSHVEMNARDLTVLIRKLDQIKALDTLQGSSYLAIQTALGVFLNRYNADMTQYKVQVVREGSSVLVMFTDKDRAAGIRGGSGKQPEFEVEMNMSDRRVLRSNFVR